MHAESVVPLAAAGVERVVDATSPPVLVIPVVVLAVILCLESVSGTAGAWPPRLKSIKASVDVLNEQMVRDAAVKSSRAVSLSSSYSLCFL